MAGKPLFRDRADMHDLFGPVIDCKTDVNILLMVGVGWGWGWGGGGGGGGGGMPTIDDQDK